MDILGGLLAVLVIWSCLEPAQSLRKVRDVHLLQDRYAYNQLLMDQAPRPYQIVFPKQVVRNQHVPISTKANHIRHHGTHEHHSHVTFQLFLDGKKYKIKLDKNEELLSAGVMVKHFEEDHRQVITKTVEHCYYQGQVKRDEWSQVAVSTCHGIRGVIQMHNETYVIQPFIGGDEGLEHPHIIFRATASKEEICGNSYGDWLPVHELHKDEFIHRHKFLKLAGPPQLSEEPPPRLMRLALVLDKTMYMALNLSEQEMTAYAIEIVNIVDMYYREINVRVALSYLEYWNVGDQFLVSSSLREMLGKFLKYKSTALQGVSFDVAYFLTGAELEGGSVGIAVPDSICTDRAVGISHSPSPFEPQQAATVLAHMIGHNLGLEHDEDGECDCADDFGCIMSTRVLASSAFHSRMFSSCSHADLNASISMEILSCLEGKPPTQFPQTCGNKVVERGEECDCGSPEECQKEDPCCDPLTCLRHYWAQCRGGPCCRNCTLLHQGHICRARTSECDVPEVCDGLLGECPPDSHVPDGHPCHGGGGYCRRGECPSLHQQCRDIWGPDAHAGDVQCFERFNPTGNFNGHCGKDATTGNYAKCPAEDAVCGLLHCQGGSQEPLYGLDKGFSKTTVSANGRTFHCKIVHGPAMMDVPHNGLTQDGVRCGQGKVCQKQQCLPLAILPLLKCPGSSNATICSGHGVCTHHDKCFCDEGWTGEDCSSRATTTLEPPTLPPPSAPILPPSPSPPSIMQTPPTPHPVGSGQPAATPVLAADLSGLSTKWLIIILASVVGGLVLVLSFTFLCYRRRSPHKLKGGGKVVMVMADGSEGCKPEGPLSTANRLISFAPLPTYRTEKLLSKKLGKKKRFSSEEESDIGELPPPPTIISDPNGLKPEKGILKNSSNRTDSDHRSSGSTTDGTGEGGPYVYDEEEDVEAEEIKEILGEEDFDPNQSLEQLNSLPESSSFDFVVPPPPYFAMPSLQPSPPPPRCVARLDLPLPCEAQRQPLLWRGAPSHTFTPPRSRVARLRNLEELLRQIDRHTIDLSPSPDEPPAQLSPSTCTSEDVRSSETDGDRRGSHGDHSPISTTSCSTMSTARNGPPNPLAFHHNPLSGEGGVVEEEGGSHPIDIPPPMHPLNLRNIFNIAHNSSHGRDNNDTPLGSSAGESGSLNGTNNSRNGCEKSSGYGSEHDPERFTAEDTSRSQSRSQSVSPPSYSAVIRTGPNQIKLVPAGRLQQTGGAPGSREELSKLLEGLPRIDAGTFERSPIVNPSPSSAALPPPPRQLGECHGDNENTPCIDRSLEEIPQDFTSDMKNAKKQHRRSLVRSKRPNSLGLSGHSSPEGEQQPTATSKLLA